MVLAIAMTDMIHVDPIREGDDSELRYYCVNMSDCRSFNRQRTVDG